jgi:branched-chain amino acid transport system substrate-binding protein
MKFLLLMTAFFFANNVWAKNKVVKIGIASNFSKVSSSSSNPYGNYFRNGIKLAIERNRDALNTAGIEIEIVEFDYGDSQYAVLKAAKKACQSDVAIVLGYVYSSHALLAAPIHKKCNLPLLTPSASANRLGKMGAYIHQATFDNSFQGEVLAEYAIETLKAKRALIIPIANCAYCQDLGKAFKQSFEKLGGIVAAELSVLEDGDDYSATAKTAKTQRFDVVVVPNHELASARIIHKLAKEGVKKPFLGGDGWGNVGEQFFNVVGSQEIEGYSLSHWLSSLPTEKSKSFVADFSKKYGKDPNDTAVLSFDATSILIHSLVSTKDHTRSGIEKSLARIEYFNGVTGEFVFQKDRAPKKSVLLLKNEGKKFSFLKLIEPSK